MAQTTQPATATVEPDALHGFNMRVLLAGSVLVIAGIFYGAEGASITTVASSMILGGITYAVGVALFQHGLVKKKVTGVIFHIMPAIVLPGGFLYGALFGSWILLPFVVCVISALACIMLAHHIYAIPELVTVRKNGRAITRASIALLIDGMSVLFAVLAVLSYQVMFPFLYFAIGTIASILVRAICSLFIKDSHKKTEFIRFMQKLSFVIILLGIVSSSL
nr:hypothetical protein [Candidatus Sigynarchaeota archaeon]